MGVYNPKKKMPTSCYMCWDSLYCEYKTKNPVKMAQGRADDCPLIEMDEEVFRHLKGCAFIIKALYKKLKEKYKCVEEDEEGIEEDFDPYQGDRDRDTFGEIY